MPVDNDRSPPLKLNRVSKQWFDDELVDFFREAVIPYVERVYGQTLHGYIYNQMEGNAFHDEIMLVDRKLLKFVKVESEPPTEYPGLISAEAWKKQHDATKVENTEVSTSIFPVEGDGIHFCIVFKNLDIELSSPVVKVPPVLASTVVEDPLYDRDSFPGTFVYRSSILDLVALRTSVVLSLTPQKSSSVNQVMLRDRR